MRFRSVGDLIAHAWRQAEPASVPQFRFELPLDTQEDVPLVAPVIGAIVGRIFDHADADASELAGTPPRGPGLAVVNDRFHGAPVGRTEWNPSDLHRGVSPRASMSLPHH